jgi:uncharacterized tellurite resistance protein B-like protein
MFETLLRHLLAPAPERLPDPEAKLALAALLVRIARSDGDYSDRERAQIDSVIGETFGLVPAAAAATRAEAEVLEEEAPDTVRFTRALKEAVAHDNRCALIEGMWRVVLVHGQSDEEAALMRLVANLLGISDVDSALARQRAERP